MPLTIADEISGEIINGLKNKNERANNIASTLPPSINYKYNEDKLLQEIKQYVNNTYNEHYSQNNYQATEFIIDGGHGVGFTLGNILKYAQRYGRKGMPSEWRKDLMKVIHYAIIALYVHDLNNKGK